MTEIALGLTYDDVLLVPRRSRVRSRQDVSTRSSFTPGIELEVPIVSANMDTVTMAPMAIAMAQLGGIGVVHRFLPIDAEATEVRRVKRFLTHVIAEPYTTGYVAQLMHPFRSPKPVAALAKVVNESGNGLTNQRGTVGMARSQDESGGCVAK